MTLVFLNIGTQEMIFIVIIILMLFGGKKLPELARGLGRGIREFKDASEDIKREISDQINNFEKDLDVTVDDKKTNTSTSEENTPSTEATEVQVSEELAATDGQVEKKFPQFTQPENSVQHDPGAHPVDETEYYKFGYNDYFTEDKPESEESKESKEEDASVEKPKDNPSQNV